MLTAGNTLLTVRDALPQYGMKITRVKNELILGIEREPALDSSRHLTI